MKISAFMLVIWYCMSIIGFDVHTCKGSGESFVVTALMGMDCADIHPEHDCSDEGRHCCDCGSHCGSGHHSDEDSFADGGCCSDDIRVLAFTGNRTDDSRQSYMTMCHFAYVLYHEYVYVSYSDIDRSSSFMPDSGLIVPEDVQSVLGIWRI